MSDYNAPKADFGNTLEENKATIVEALAHLDERRMGVLVMIVATVLEWQMGEEKRLTK